MILRWPWLSSVSAPAVRPISLKNRSIWSEPAPVATLGVLTRMVRHRSAEYVVGGLPGRPSTPSSSRSVMASPFASAASESDRIRSAAWSASLARSS